VIVSPAIRRSAVALVLPLLLCSGRASATSAGLDRDSPVTSRVVELQLQGEVEPIMAEYIADGIGRANRDGASLILLRIDTPGGLDQSMRQIIQHILESPVPVVTYVAPSGARAASAGFFILLAADVAAMAPGTHAGAASPVAAVGGYPVALDETMRSKVVNDASAYLRSYASRRGRNVELAETAITSAKAFTEQEAIDGTLCDLIAPSTEALLAKLDGRTVTRFDGNRVRLSLARPAVFPIEMTPRQRFLARIVEPDMFFVLLLVGVLGLYTEFTHPGMILPGVVGVIALVLALFAMHLLPVNVAGLLLLAVALALFVLEAKFTSHGVLGAGGVVAMLLGALMLVRSPLTAGGVSIGTAIGATLPFALITILLMRLVLRSRAWVPQTGVEELVREIGEVRESIPAAGAAGHGLVFVHGELWRAAAQAAIPRGARVRIVRVDGLTLIVEPVDERPAA
jgi:membrane-bound serine protease (ClpP class)